MRSLAYPLLVAAAFAPLAGCVVHDREVVRDRPVYREEVRRDDRPVIVERERHYDEHHDNGGIRVDVRP